MPFHVDFQKESVRKRLRRERGKERMIVGRIYKKWRGEKEKRAKER